MIHPTPVPSQRSCVPLYAALGAGPLNAGGLLRPQVLVWRLREERSQNAALDFQAIARVATEQAPWLYSALPGYPREWVGSVAWIALPDGQSHVLIAGSQNNSVLHLWHHAALAPYRQSPPVQVRFAKPPEGEAEGRSRLPDEAVCETKLGVFTVAAWLRRPILVVRCRCW